ncbi:hypothetical protein Vadar_033641 [Vaccinium darrowii]|uniref:Uncharacterized protein n=1 Tax=Vaccinium darrowii TaxID=229202 RepID=A0ACB7YHX5_9ERIC|nr:hypothetical protein Vadar_033641 [Vaccinium darrowii]
MGGCPPACRSNSMGSITAVQRLLPFSVHKTTSYHHSSPSSPSSANPPHQPNNNVPHDSATIAMRYHLTFARIAAANRIEIRSHLLKLFSVDNAAGGSKGPIMADKDTKSGDESSTLDDVKKVEEEKEKKLLPPPPEKPLPGDCCGSGCVRCVWDIYYEELEDYNKLNILGGTQVEFAATGADSKSSTAYKYHVSELPGMLLPELLKYSVPSLSNAA